MSALPSSPLVSVEDYLAGESVAEQKHEYVGGLIYMMAGARNRHNRIASRAQGLLFVGLRGSPCEAFNSDTKARVHAFEKTRFYYPDAMVVCELNPDDDVFQDRPVVIVEVLSESTRRADEGEKRDAYLEVPSLKVLLLVESDRPSVSVDRRGEDGVFTRTWHEGEDAVVPLPEIGLELPLRELHAG